MSKTPEEHMKKIDELENKIKTIKDVLQEVSYEIPIEKTVLRDKVMAALFDRDITNE